MLSYSEVVVRMRLLYDHDDDDAAAAGDDDDGRPDVT